MLLATAPAQAQPWKKDRMAQIKAEPMMRRTMLGFDTEQESKKAEMKAKHPLLFQHYGFKPAPKSNNVTRVPLSLRPRGRFNVAHNGNGQILLAANNASLIANVLYAPEMDDYTISRFSANTPTTMETLVTGYAFPYGASIQDNIYYGVYLNTSYYYTICYSFDTETWEELDFTYLDDTDFSMLALELATAQYMAHSTVKMPVLSNLVSPTTPT